MPMYNRGVTGSKPTSYARSFAKAFPAGSTRSLQGLLGSCYTTTVGGRDIERVPPCECEVGTTKNGEVGEGARCILLTSRSELP